MASDAGIYQRPHNSQHQALCPCTATRTGISINGVHVYCTWASPRVSSPPSVFPGGSRFCLLQMTASSLFAFAVSIVMLCVGAFAKAVGDEMLLLACVFGRVGVSSNFVQNWQRGWLKPCRVCVCVSHSLAACTGTCTLE